MNKPEKLSSKSTTSYLEQKIKRDYLKEIYNKIMRGFYYDIGHRRHPTILKPPNNLMKDLKLLKYNMEIGDMACFYRKSSCMCQWHLAYHIVLYEGTVTSQYCQ